MRRKRVAYKRQKQNKLAMGLIVGILVILSVVVGVEKSELKDKQDAYIAKEAEMQAKIDGEHQRAKELEEYAKYVQTRKYVEDVAKEKLGLVYEDEIVFKTE